MKLDSIETKNGIKVRFEKNNYRLEYPEKIWKRYPLKDVLQDNLTHLLTINFPLVAGINKLKYNTALPLFKSFFDKMVMSGIPHAVEGYKIKTEDMLKQFMNIKYVFSDSDAKFPDYCQKNNERAVVSFSSGKDSLLSLALANEIGLNPVPIYIDDTVSASENKIKRTYVKKIAEEFKLKSYIIKNEIEKLNDFETWDEPESCLGYTHLLTSFCFISLPVSHYYKSKYIIIGNENNLNYSFMNSDGFITVPSFDQTRKWMAQQNLMIKLMTDNSTSIVSLIEPLTNLGIIKILFNRYPEYAKYMMSCYGLDASNEKRWCHDCAICANSYLLLSAVGDVSKVGFKENMFDRRFKKKFALFGGGDIYDKAPECRDEDLYAFYLAYKRGAKGYLIDKFKSKFLKEAIEREDELYKKFFSLHKATTIPPRIKKKVFDIYEEELNR